MITFHGWQKKTKQSRVSLKIYYQLISLGSLDSFDKIACYLFLPFYIFRLYKCIQFLIFYSPLNNFLLNIILYITQNFHCWTNCFIYFLFIQLTVVLTTLQFKNIIFKIHNLISLMILSRHSLLICR